jgi:arylsulfatase A-like enzyme
MERRLPYRLHQDNPVYAGLVESMDDAVGVVLNELKKLGLEKNTIVIFTGDNGGVVSGDNYSTNNAPLRGGKGYQWEGGTIPERALIWHYPHYGNQGGDPSSIIRKGDWKLIHYYEDGHEELYNLKADFSETTNLAAKNLKIVKKMSKELFNFLNKVGAKFPKKDPEYSEETEKEYYAEILKKLWPQLEEQRHKMISPDYKPNADWWGSMVTKD